MAKLRFPILSLIAIAVSLNAVTARADSQEDDSRKVWQYETPAGTRTIVGGEGGRWVIHYPNGTKSECEELDRTPEYIEIRNLRNQAVLRLWDKHGTLRKSANAPFRRFGEGKWIDEGEFPTSEDGFGATDYKIRVVYFVPRDRQPTRNYQQKIEVVLALASEVMRNDLRSKGHKTLGPEFETRDEKLVIHLLRGNRNASAYNDSAAFNSNNHFDAITQEIDQRLGSPKNHIVMVFAETYDEGNADRVWPGHIAKAVALPPNGGIGVFSGWVLRDEFCTTDIQMQRRAFLDPTPILGRTAIGHRGPSSPRAEFVEDGIGGVLHELAHTFGLPHDHRNRQVFLMGEGFRHLRWNIGATGAARQRPTFSPENTRLLMASRYLNPEVDRTDNQPPQVSLNTKRTSKGISVTVTAEDDKHLATAVLLERTSGERKMLTGWKLSGKSQSVDFIVPIPPVAQGDPDLMVLVVDGGGNYTKTSRKQH